MENNSKKIMFVDNFGDFFGGGQLSLLGILENLDRNIFQPLVVLPYEGDLSREIRKMGIELYIIPFGTIKTMNIFVNMLSIFRFYTLIKKEEINLVHTNALRPTFYAGIAAKIFGVPLIWHVRDLKATVWIDRFLSYLTTYIIAVSEVVAKRFPRLKKHDRLSVIYNGIDTERFKPLPKDVQIMQELRIEPGAPVIGIVGYLEPRKGQEIFLMAASRILTKFPKAKFLLVGKDKARGGLYQIEYEDLAEKLGIKDRVVFTGYRKDILRIMSVIDIFVCPFKDEAFGKVVVEAMALARPVVAYRDGAFPEIVKHNKTGILIEPDNQDALVQSILRLLNNSQEVEQLGQEARKWVEQNCRFKITFQKIEKLFEEIISKS